MKAKVLCFVTFLCLGSTPGWAQTNSETFCSGTREVSIYFGNGVLNSAQDADRSLIELQRRLESRLPSGFDYEFKLALNESRLRQALDLFAQRNVDGFTRFWRMLGDLSIAPDWFREHVVDTQVQMLTRVLERTDPDLQAQVESYREDLERGRKVIVVAHSQGNLYANSAYELLGHSDDFRVVSVGTPATFVAGDGA